MKNKFRTLLDKISFIIYLVLPFLAIITVVINWIYTYNTGNFFSFNAYHLLICVLPIELLIYFYKLFTREFRISILDLMVYLFLLGLLIITLIGTAPGDSFWISKLNFKIFSQFASFALLLLNSRFLINKEKFENIIDKTNYFIIIILTILVPVTFFINWFCIYQLRVDFSFKIHQFLTFILPIESFIYLYK